jgi:hypothetical protein
MSPWVVCSVIVTVPARSAELGGWPTEWPGGAGWAGVLVKSQLAVPVDGRTGTVTLGLGGGAAALLSVIVVPLPAHAASKPSRAVAAAAAATRRWLAVMPLPFEIGSSVISLR